MQMPPALTRDLILIGGGHAHALVLRGWGMKPLSGARVTVINPGATAPYTGMLPGYIAGHYDRAALDIDLVRLCRFAGARLIDQAVCGLDPAAKTVTLGDGRVLGYDVASLDVGITGQLPQIDGFAANGIPAKPLDGFARAWADLLRGAAPDTAVAVIGGGLAGCELALAMAHALQAKTGRANVTIIESAAQIGGLLGRSRRVMLRALARYGIRLEVSAQVRRVEPDFLTLADGQQIRADFCVGAAGAMAHPWLCNVPLKHTDGFVHVDQHLNAIGHDSLFAVGDCAHLCHAPRPKAGVFAVRAAPVLAHNLRAALSGTQPRPYRPQKNFLKLVSLGGRRALADRGGGLGLHGALWWRLKNHIDQRFMTRLQHLPTMPAPPPPRQIALGDDGAAPPLCGGCGAKLGAGVLERTLAALPPLGRPDIQSAPGDDAAILTIAGQRQVQSTDHLRGFWPDHALMARIAAVHALGDIWAMGAHPQAALASITIPQMSPALQARTMAEIMQAARQVLDPSNCEIIGGHSTMGAELSIGFAISGLCPQPPITHRGALPGDAIVLTRPIGSGTLLAGEMARLAEGQDILDMLAQMAAPQGQAAQVLAGAKAHAMTDVTGFGLAGHLLNLCRASDVAAQIWLDTLPLYPGAAALCQRGVRSSLYAANRDHAPVQGALGPTAPLLHDPQTAGGLLAAIAPDQLPGVLAALPGAVHIGRFTAGPPALSCTSRQAP